MKKKRRDLPTKIKISMLMTPTMANFSGINVHGGEILKLLDQVAYACAAQYCKTYVVTLSSDLVLFKSPIKVGSLVTFKAKINYTGTTSMEIGIKVVSTDVKTKEKSHTNTCYFTMISVDENMKPKAVPKYTPITNKEIKRYEEAIQRREFREKLQKRS
ncbi:acyl-CoA thioesterase [Malaciobacter molluscorum LMG 25693]|uniref:Acyl-CoA thioesterase n=1 Tax=Malaciobacter molluscorum LMG 25693 TaxID=870501 RepID=A0A2G1DGT4_9BACT|nr:acyl-CoA thioesterase [Malaciobacter molluscorum]AXX92322.1 acyl-CoA thioesterase [Malaciobacter molluscorum LMG 25693]PHO17693.1 acyl-CoA thioesterase [Malaciobacter molluscorum LMG 25693]RXJ93566.1 acyl-CoA thioesterase [Malaciobacter molluscorum]